MAFISYLLGGGLWSSNYLVEQLNVLILTNNLLTYLIAMLFEGSQDVLDLSPSAFWNPVLCVCLSGQVHKNLVGRRIIIQFFRFTPCSMAIPDFGIVETQLKVGRCSGVVGPVSVVVGPDDVGQ